MNEKNTNHPHLLNLLQTMIMTSEHIQYKGISLSQSLEIPFYNYLRESLELQGKPFRLWLHCIKWFLKILKRLIVNNITNLRKPNFQLDKFAGKKYILVICDFSGHIEKMAANLLEQFPKNNIFFITGNPSIFNRWKGKFPNSLNIYKKIYCYRLNHLFYYLNYYKKILKNLKDKCLLFRLYLFSAICSILEAIDFYNCFFENVKISAVITTCDALLNEHIATVSAKKQGIMTFTNQHGEIADPTGCTPIVSDKIFVWGEKSKEILIKNGIPEEKIVISGNPKFDRVHSWYLPNREEIRARLRIKYGLKKGLLVITYLSPGIFSTAELTPAKSFELFKCFCQVSKFPVNIIAKLHYAQDNKKIFRQWLGELKLSDRVLLFQEEDLFDILAITDIAVTLHSTTGVESIGFGIPTIVLNILKDINAREYITYVEDSIECRTPEEFKEVIKKLVLEPKYYQKEIKRTLEIREKYIKNSENFNTSEFIYNYIINNSISKR